MLGSRCALVVHTAQEIRCQMIPIPTLSPLLSLIHEDRQALPLVRKEESKSVLKNKAKWRCKNTSVYSMYWSALNPKHERFNLA